MKVFITGATGLVGGKLSKALLEAGNQVVALSRDADRARSVLGEDVCVVEGTPSDSGDWMAQVSGCDGVVNLAGERVVGRRWNDEVKRQIRDSRVLTTTHLATAIGQGSSPPRVFISASAVGYYGLRDFEDELDEGSPPGSDFLAEVCKQWEAATDLGEIEGAVRKTILRIGVVLDPSDGALKMMLPPFRLGLGGPIGRGRMAFPWIHIDDLVSMILWTLRDETVSGVLNATAPGSVTGKDFARALGKALHRPALFPVPPFVLHLLYGEGAFVVTSGQRVYPKRAKELGFDFEFPDVDGALMDLLNCLEPKMGFLKQ